GLCFAEYKANHYDAAEKFCLQTIDCVNQLKDSALLVKAVNIEASIYNRKGEFQKAVEWFFKQLKFAEAIHDSVNVASALGNIGVIYTSLQNFPEAIKFQKMALEKKIHNGQIKEMATTYSNLGNCFQSIHQSDSALYYYHLGLSVSLSNKLLKLS